MSGQGGELANRSFRVLCSGKFEAVRCKANWRTAKITRQQHGEQSPFGGGFLGTGAGFLAKIPIVIFANKSQRPLFGENSPTKNTLGRSPRLEGSVTDAQNEHDGQGDERRSVST